MTEPSGDLWVRGGSVFDPAVGAPRPGGVLVRAGRIVAVGPDRRLRDDADGAEQLDLAGGLVTPGLHDAHCHFSEGGLSLLLLDCRGVRSADELATRARDRGAALGPGAWVTGRGWDDRGFTDPKRWPHRGDLDAACPQNPVLLQRVDGHAAVANTVALRAAGLTDDAADPPGGRLGRDDRGRLDGLLYETAIEHVRGFVPPPTADEQREGLRRSFALARRYGLTSVQDERGWPELYVELAEASAMTCRVTVWNQIERPLEELEAWREAFPASERLRPGLLKGFLDGSLGSRTALFFDDYADAPGNRGVATLEPERIRGLVVAADRAGFTCGLHAIGDAAVARALDAFEAARRENGPDGPVHRIEHAQHLRLADARRFGPARVVASMQPSHLSADLGMVEPRLGAGRLAGAYPWRTLQESGASLAFGSDFPIESMDPRTSLYAACTRRAWGGEGPLPPVRERLTLAEALDHFTRGAAWAEGLVHEKGTLAPGAFGDLTVWRDDLFRLSREELLSAPVAATVVAGEVVHRA